MLNEKKKPSCYYENFDSLVDHVAILSNRFHITPTEATIMIIDSVDFWSFIHTLEEFDKTIEDITGSVHNSWYWSKLNRVKKGDN